MKITRLEASNFMRLVAVEITPEGNIIQITGPNGAGKSCLLDAIVAVLGGGHNQVEKPIRDGESKAKVVLETETFIGTRKFAAGKSTLTLKHKGTAPPMSPQQFLKSITGPISFDPLAFSTMNAKDQRQTLLTLLGLDLNVHDAKINGLREERKVMLANKKRADGDLELLTLTPGLPSAEVSVAQLSQLLTDGVKVNNRATAIDSAFGVKKQLVAENQGRIDGLQAQIETLLEECGALEAEAGQIDLVDTAAIQQQIDTAETTNQKIRANLAYHKADAGVDRLVEEVKDKYDAIQDAEAAKANAIGQAEMPVPGLGVDEVCVTFDGIPMAQVNHAKRVEVSLSVAIAMNPELTVMLINGNGLDTDTLKTIAAKVEGTEYQVWMEVQTNKNKGFGIEIVDGMVVSEKHTEQG